MMRRYRGSPRWVAAASVTYPSIITHTGVTASPHPWLPHGRGSGARPVTSSSTTAVAIDLEEDDDDREELQVAAHQDGRASLLHDPLLTSEAASLDLMPPPSSTPSSMIMTSPLRFGGEPFHEEYLNRRFTAATLESGYQSPYWVTREDLEGLGISLLKGARGTPAFGTDLFNAEQTTDPVTIASLSEQRASYLMSLGLIDSIGGTGGGKTSSDEEVVHKYGATIDFGKGELIPKIGDGAEKEIELQVDDRQANDPPVSSVPSSSSPATPKAPSQAESVKNTRHKIKKPLVGANATTNPSSVATKDGRLKTTRKPRSKVQKMEQPHTALPVDYYNYSPELVDCEGVLLRAKESRGRLWTKEIVNRLKAAAQMKSLTSPWWATLESVQKLNHRLERTTTSSSSVELPKLMTSEGAKVKKKRKLRSLLQEEGGDEDLAGELDTFLLLSTSKRRILVDETTAVTISVPAVQGTGNGAETAEEDGKRRSQRGGQGRAGKNTPLPLKTVVVYNISLEEEEKETSLEEGGGFAQSGQSINDASSPDKEKQRKLSNKGKVVAESGLSGDQVRHLLEEVKVQETLDNKRYASLATNSGIEILSPGPHATHQHVFVKATQPKTGSVGSRKVEITSTSSARRKTGSSSFSSSGDTEPAKLITARPSGLLRIDSPACVGGPTSTPTIPPPSCLLEEKGKQQVPATQWLKQKEEKWFLDNNFATEATALQLILDKLCPILGWSGPIQGKQQHHQRVQPEEPQQEQQQEEVTAPPSPSPPTPLSPATTQSEHQLVDAKAEKSDVAAGDNPNQEQDLTIDAVSRNKKDEEANIPSQSPVTSTTSSTLSPQQPISNQGKDLFDLMPQLNVWGNPVSTHVRSAIRALRKKNPTLFSSSSSPYFIGKPLSPYWLNMNDCKTFGVKPHRDAPIAVASSPSIFGRSGARLAATSSNSASSSTDSISYLASPERRSCSYVNASHLEDPLRFHLHCWNPRTRRAQPLSARLVETLNKKQRDNFPRDTTGKAFSFARSLDMICLAASRGYTSLYWIDPHEAIYFDCEVFAGAPLSPCGLINADETSAPHRFNEDLCRRSNLIGPDSRSLPDAVFRRLQFRHHERDFKSLVWFTGAEVLKYGYEVIPEEKNKGVRVDGRTSASASQKLKKSRTTSSALAPASATVYYNAEQLQHIQTPTVPDLKGRYLLHGREEMEKMTQLSEEEAEELKLKKISTTTIEPSSSSIPLPKKTGIQLSFHQEQ